MYSKEEAKQIRILFWEKFGSYCEVRPELRHRNKSWLYHRTGIRGLVLKFEADREQASVIIEIDRKDENARMMMYETLEKYKNIIGDGFEYRLIWDFLYVRNNGKEVCRVYTVLEGVNIYRQKDWPQIFNYFIHDMLQLEENYQTIRDVLKADLEQQGIAI